METTKLAWGPRHLFSTTPKWASQVVSILLTLIALYGAFVLKFPDIIPAVTAMKIGGAISIITWVFQSFGLKGNANAGIVMEANSLAAGVTEDQVRAMILELTGGKASPAGEEPVANEEPEPEQAPKPVPGLNVVIGPIPQFVDSNMYL